MADVKLNPAQLEAIEAALKRPDTTILPPPSPAADAAVDDWAQMRIERRGHEWRATWSEAGAAPVTSEWRPRESWYSQLSLFLGKLRNFAMKGLGKIPLALNPPRARDENS